MDKNIATNQNRMCTNYLIQCVSNITTQRQVHAKIFALNWKTCKLESKDMHNLQLHGEMSDLSQFE